MTPPRSFRARIAVCALLVHAAVLAGCAHPSDAASEPPSDEPKRIVGWVERVTVPPLDFPVKAKLDTGARTSSIHAEDIERFVRDGEKWVRFTIAVEDPDDVVHRERLERPLYRNVRIKDHDDASDRRAVVELELCLDGRTERAQFTLADRSRFLYPVLLGRRFLGGRFVVDPEQTFLASSNCSEVDDDSESEAEAAKDEKGTP
jgi:hypothetical protein